MHEKRFVDALNSRLPISLTLRNELFVVLLLITIAVFWLPLSALYLLTREQSHYSHLLVVPLVSAFVFYQERKILLTSPEWSPLSGLVLIGFGALGYWQADRSASGVDYVSLTTLALVMVTWGSFLLCFGTRMCRAFSFGLLFLLCMAPFPASFLHSIIVFLQQSAADATDIGFSMLGVPVIRDDIVFKLSNISIRVDEGCSAIRSALSLVITSIVAGHFFLHSAWAKASLVVVMVPLAIIDNGIRIVGLSLLANYVDKSFLLDGRLHDLGGYLTFVLSITVLIVCIALFWRIEHRYGLYAGGRAEVRSNITTAHEPV